MEVRFLPSSVMLVLICTNAILTWYEIALYTSVLLYVDCVQTIFRPNV